MSRFLISVGGTGQHLALAATRLRHLGALGDCKLIAIDPDNKSPLTATLEKPELWRGHHPLGAFKVFAPLDTAKDDQLTFERVFVDPDHARERELFEMMFEAKMGSIPVHKGMYGTPCVGSTVFADGVKGGALRSVLEPLSAATEVVVCGSVIGGTGAGVLDKLIQQIRVHYKKDLFGVFLLPWFEIGPSNAGTDNAITDATITRNASHGIKYFYDHTLKELTASVLLGQPGGSKELAGGSRVLAPVRIKQGDMGEHPHYLHLVGVWAATKLQELHTANRGVRAYTVAHDTSGNAEGWLLDESWAGTSLRKLVRAYQVALNMLDFILDPQNKAKLTGWYAKGAIGRTLDARPWGDLHHSIVANEPNDASQAAFVAQLCEEFRAEAEKIRFCTDWVKTVYREPELLRVGHADTLLDTLRNNTKDSAVHWPLLVQIWSGKSLPRDTNAKRTPDAVAKHHLRALVEYALAN